jgi:hypothetical protein
MKDGTVAESGTHSELMLKNGEYAKLYNIQASAFVTASSTSEAQSDLKLEAEEVSNMNSYRSKLLMSNAMG